MKYAVVWMPVAEQRLTQLWLGSRMRHAISDAADQIDAALERNPHDCGESRDGDRRVMHKQPLGVLFEINDDGRQVRVLSVWSY
jgi:hypothetical protein